MSDQQLVNRIRWMNKTFRLPANDFPVDQGRERLLAFECVVHKELTELDSARREGDEIERFVKVADLLGDVIVYTLSEADRWGIPIIDVFHAIMDSQESKLVNGSPVMSPDGTKFDQGPNFTPPENRIREIILNKLREKNGERRTDETENKS